MVQNDSNPLNSDDVNYRLSREDKIELYRQMLLIRRFEERSVKSYQQGKIGGFCHTYIGQESVAVGSISVLGPNDHVITAYRDHGHAIAVGMDPNALMAELYGKKTGCSKGKGGSMHYFDPQRNFWGGHGIVGGQTPLGAGIAFALKYREEKGACLCYLGDGAVNQGPFFESLNLAALWKLPVIYIIENNRYSMGTSQERGCAGKSLAQRGSPFGIHSDEMNGNDIYEVRSKVSEALQRAYNQSLPTVLEAHTYRYRGHSMSDPDQTYRTKEEILEQREYHDPISFFENNLLKDGILSKERIQEMEEVIRKQVEFAAEFAENSEFPSLEDIQKDILWEMDHVEHKTSQGTMFF